MSECHFEDMFFLELPFWVQHIPFWGVREGGGVPLKCLKKFTDPVSFLRSLGPLGWYCTKSFNSSGAVTCDDTDKIMLSAYWV